LPVNEKHSAVSSPSKLPAYFNTTHNIIPLPPRLVPEPYTKTAGKG